MYEKDFTEKGTIKTEEVVSSTPQSTQTEKEEKVQTLQSKQVELSSTSVVAALASSGGSSASLACSVSVFVGSFASIVFASASVSYTSITLIFLTIYTLL